MRVRGGAVRGTVRFGTSATVSVVVASQVVQTDPDSSLASTSVTLNGTLLDMDGQSSITCYFRYRRVGEENNTKTADQALSSVQSFSESVTGLTSGVQYEYWAIAESGSETLTGGIEGFTTP